MFRLLAIKYVDFSAEIERKLLVATAKARCNTLSAVTEFQMVFWQC